MRYGERARALPVRTIRAIILNARRLAVASGVHPPKAQGQQICQGLEDAGACESNRHAPLPTEMMALCVCMQLAPTTERNMIRFCSSAERIIESVVACIALVAPPPTSLERPKSTRSWFANSLWLKMCTQPRLGERTKPRLTLLLRAPKAPDTTRQSQALSNVAHRPLLALFVATSFPHSLHGAHDR